MTTDEQAPVRCAVCGHAEFYEAGLPIHICEMEPGGDHSDDYCMECERPAAYHAFVPAPEETVETTPRAKDWMQREFDDARRLNDSLPHWLKPRRAEPPAPEPAGEAEERCASCLHERHEGRCTAMVTWGDDSGTGHSAGRCACPGSGTPGLTEAQAELVASIHEAALVECRAWCAKSHVPDDDYRSRAAFMAGYATAAHAAAEACAPLEARIAELERHSRVQNDLITREWGLRADAERKLEEMREALTTANEALRQNITTWLALSRWLEEPYPDDPRWTPWTRFGKRAADAAVNARAVIRRALTPPASTAAEETTDA